MILAVLVLVHAGLVVAQDECPALTQIDEPNPFPVLTSDESGNPIYYLSEQEAYPLVFQVNGQIVKLDPLHRLAIPTRSADGKSFAFVGGSLETGQNVFVVEIENNDVSQLTQYTFDGSGNTKNLFFGWSPDGTKLAFSGYSKEIGEEDVYVIDLETQGITNVTQDFAMGAMTPQVTNEGVVSFYPSTAQMRILYVIHQGGEVTPTAQVSGEGVILGDAKFSPDGEYIAYTIGVNLVHTTIVVQMVEDPFSTWVINIPNVQSDLVGTHLEWGDYLIATHYLYTYDEKTGEIKNTGALATEIDVGEVIKTPTDCYGQM